MCSKIEDNTINNVVNTGSPAPFKKKIGVLNLGSLHKVH